MKSHRKSLLIIIFCLIACQSHYKPSWGRVQSFKQLESDKNSEITLIDKKSQITIMAIHGGKIESGTSELANELFEQLKSNLYLFESEYAPDYNHQSLQSGYMHLTSHKFNDPQLLELSKRSKNCLSIHGFPNPKIPICIGGGASQSIKQIFLKYLKPYGACIDCCPPYLGRNAKNVVNQCSDWGIQLELNPQIRRKILEDKNFLEALGHDISKATEHSKGVAF